MMKKLTYGMAAASFAALFSTTAANALIIDDFTAAEQKMQILAGTAQAVPITGKLLDNAAGCAAGANAAACVLFAPGSSDFSQSGVGPVAGILGGYRDIQTELVVGTPNGFSTAAFTVGGGGGVFSHVQDSLAHSNTYITWGGTGDQLAGTGLGSADLTDSGASNQFHLIVINADAGVNWSLYLEDGLSNSFLHTFSNPSEINAPGVHLYIPFSVFVGVDMQDIEFIRFGANTTNIEDFDTTIDFFETTGVPEPASLTLLGAGIMGLGYFGKRRRKA